MPPRPQQAPMLTTPEHHSPIRTTASPNRRAIAIRTSVAIIACDQQVHSQHVDHKYSRRPTTSKCLTLRNSNLRLLNLTPIVLNSNNNKPLRPNSRRHQLQLPPPLHLTQTMHRKQQYPLLCHNRHNNKLQVVLLLLLEHQNRLRLLSQALPPSPKPPHQLKPRPMALQRQRLVHLLRPT